MKQEGKMALSEGKIALSPDVYQFLSSVVSPDRTTDYLLYTFGHCFLTLAWNLMGRSISVATLMFAHLTWEHDSLVITLPKHKGNLS